MQSKFERIQIKTQMQLNCRKANRWFEFNVPFQHKYGYIKSKSNEIIGS